MKSAASRQSVWSCGNYRAITDVALRKFSRRIAGRSMDAICLAADAAAHPGFDCIVVVNLSSYTQESLFPWSLKNVFQ
jgi:hypothetical protein